MRTFHTGFNVAWAYCDAAGIVFYPHFYTWFDQATETLFRANSPGHSALEVDFRITGMPLVETGAQYSHPCRLGHELDMASWVDEWSSRSSWCATASTGIRHSMGSSAA